MNPAGSTAKTPSSPMIDATGMIGDLSRRGVLDRRPDDNDRRRTLVVIADSYRTAVAAWLGGADRGRRAALGPLTAEQRALVITPLRAYEEAVSSS
ncbi:hypothetical protein [Nocardia sp. NPDC003963]